MLKSILKILSEDLSFLFDHFKTINLNKYNAEIDASVEIPGDVITIYLSSDREQLALGLKKTIKHEYNPDYYGISIIRQYFGDYNFESSVYTPEHGVFLKQHLNEILILFSDENYAETRMRLNQIEKDRTKRIYPNW